MEAFNAYLKTFPHYTPQAYETARPYLSEKHLAPGEYFLNQGQVCKSIGFIEKGLVRLYYLNDGKEITHCFCKEHSITCSYSSLITQQPSDTAIQAIEPSTLIVFSYESLQKLYTKDLFWQQLGRIAGEKEYVAVDSHNRFLNDLSATERYLQILKNDPTLLQRVPLNYLASYLHVSPETLSRIRKKIIRT